MNQIIFILTVVIALAGLFYSFRRVFLYMKMLKPFYIKDYGQRIVVTLKVAIGQIKIFKRPIIGAMHALVLWGFLIILVGTIEMFVDGILGIDKSLSFFGIFYDIIFALGDIFALIIAIMVTIFLFRRIFLNIKRFSGIEMTHKAHLDAILALFIILSLMISLLGINVFYYAHNISVGAEIHGVYPVSSIIAGLFANTSADTLHLLERINWWFHIEAIFIFMNILPYSKHFHVFMSIPNVFLSRLTPLGKIDTMTSITEEIKSMLAPETAFEENEEELEDLQRFGVLDVEDTTWKNYFDSLACTQCGRCSSVCPANITGKKLSPRKVMIDIRKRMKEKAPSLLKQGKTFSDEKSLINDYITTEELWACTTCNACAEECPININHPSIILEMRRYLVMEESAAPSELNVVFQNIENNGAPWQVSFEDRMLWADNIILNDIKIEVPILADLQAEEKQPEYLFWVGSAGSIDDRYKKVMQEFIKILYYLKTDYAVLGMEESDSGDIARRGGNEMSFQMQALMNIEILNNYKVKKIITCDPHEYNTLKNEYPDLGGNYEVIHHSDFLNSALLSGKIKLNKDTFAKNIITYHDPCYLGRMNKIYSSPRNIISKVNSKLIEMPRNKTNALCCGAGGGQMFKEAEKGNKEVFIERIEEVIKTGANIVVTSCPFCMTMMTDGIKYKNKDDDMKNLDIAELISASL